MAAWALPLLGCWLLLLKQVSGANASQTNITTTETTTATSTTTVTIDPFAEYHHGGAMSVCRETLAVPSLDNVGRREESHAVTHVDSIGTCRDFCDEIQPCYGFEFDRDSSETDYGNCEIWVVPILRFKITSDAKFNCYNKTSTYSSSGTAKPSVTAGFSIANLKAADILANQSVLNLSQSLYSMAASYINTSVIAMNAMPVVTVLGGGTGLQVRFTFASTQLHSIELHNAIRVLGIAGGRKHSGTWGEVTIAHPPGLVAQIQSFFAGLTDYLTGTPTATADFITLTPLAPSLGTTAPTGSTTYVVTTASSAHSSRPILLLVGWMMAKMM